jgi:hypothetical protein
MARNRYGNKKQKNQLELVAEEIANKIPNEYRHTQFQGGHAVDVKQKLYIRTQQIAIGIPMDEVVFSHFLTNILAVGIMPWDAIITTLSTYLPEARNSIHDKFLDGEEGTHLFMLDSDVLPPPSVIYRLLVHNKPLVGGWYVKKEKYHIKDVDGNDKVIQRPVVYDFNDKEEFVQRIAPGSGLESVAGAGAGCWMMSREVAEKIGRSPYGDGAGEDLILCRKLHEAGVERWIDWDIKCAHTGVFWV